eukprot:TRINITY_DN659_c3_g1_i1.p1 TRINITY_DN659_c3_g1~~TRINITY_DN659_c3_g1_i1.p1  ORF type:complete len:192 (+),score=2.03 TRINITY_DN659_c3_g1_i1:71-646(+)
MSTPASSTIDEPIWDTVMRDARSIGRKIKMVAMPCVGPAPDVNELKDWDLWGPLLLCVVLAIILTFHSDNLSTDSSVLFAAVCMIIAVGSVVVTFNAKFLGGKISFFQCLCTLGYCLFPLNVCGAILISPVPIREIWQIKVLLVGLCWYWACWASLGFIAGTIPPKRRMLAVYPIALFYFFLGWMLAVSIR